MACFVKKRLSLDDKVKIINLYDSGKPSLRTIAHQFQISKALVSNILANRIEILNLWSVIKNKFIENHIKGTVRSNQIPNAVSFNFNQPQDSHAIITSNGKHLLIIVFIFFSNNLLMLLFL